MTKWMEHWSYRTLAACISLGLMIGMGGAKTAAAGEYESAATVIKPEGKEMVNDFSVYDDTGEASAKTPENTREPAVIYGRGSYVVGQDIPPGEYAVFTEDVSSLNTYATCTLTLYKSESDERRIGDFSFQHHGLITLYRGQHLILSRGYAVDAALADIAPGPSGMYKVGRDMEAGVYRLTPLTSEGARYALYNDVRYYYDYIDEYLTFFEPAVITVQEGQYLELTDVASIEKIE